MSKTAALILGICIIIAAAVNNWDAVRLATGGEVSIAKAMKSQTNCKVSSILAYVEKYPISHQTLNVLNELCRADKEEDS